MARWRQVADLGVGERAVAAPGSAARTRGSGFPAPSASERNTSNARTSSSTSPTAARSVRTTSAAETRVGEHEREVDGRRREARRRAERAVAAGGVEERVELELGRHDRRLEPERGEHLGCDLADGAGVVAVDHDPGRPPGAIAGQRVAGSSVDVVDPQGVDDRA